MPDLVEIRSGVYQDSVVLMGMSDRIRQLDGISQCLVAMATELNLALLADLGFSTSTIDETTTADMIVAIRGDTAASVETASEWFDIAMVERRVDPSDRTTGVEHRTLRSAVASVGANLAVISLPGRHVVPEAVDAIRGGANVMIFSDGISLEDERRLKTLAQERGLMVMGPDCGTAHIGGIGIGFANDVERGEIGIVAASGTGAQHLCCLLDASDIGVSQVVGVGGRDLSDDIGGLSTIRALQLLDEDPDTAHIVVVSKRLGPTTAQRIADTVSRLDTPVTLGLLGEPGITLTKVAETASVATGRSFRQPFSHVGKDSRQDAYLAGLFSGGTLATEAMQVISVEVDRIQTLDSFGLTPTARAIASHSGHFIVDLGDDRLTAGRPHPMIDPGFRRDIIRQLAEQPDPRHLLLDIVLGYGAHADPAGALAQSIAGYLDRHPGGSVVASLVGSNRDHQDLSRQRNRLIEAGCDVFESNAEAAQTTAARLTRGSG